MRAFLASLLLTTQLSAQEGPVKMDLGLYLQGRDVFEQQCSPCHGRTGRGDGDWAKDVTDKPRNFRTGTFKFRTTPLGFLPTAADLERTLRTGVSGTMMPAFTQLSDHDLTAVLTYIRSFSNRWKNPDNYHAAIPLPDPPAWFSDPTVRSARAASTALLFQATCAACHGTAGKGNGPAAASLIDFWLRPSKPADFTKPHRKSGPHPQDLYRTIALGLDGTPMTAYRDILPSDTIWALVAHIQSLSAAADK
jgi:mono/diheme cytochrome c family protein